MRSAVRIMNEITVDFKRHLHRPRFLILLKPVLQFFSKSRRCLFSPMSLDDVSINSKLLGETHEPCTVVTDPVRVSCDHRPSEKLA